MGMYTGIRFKGYIKPEFRENFELIALDGDWKESSDEIFKKYGEYSRASFIPCGALSYMPDEWETDPRNYEYSQATDGFKRSYNNETGYWTFQCSLKNYDDTIEEFFKLLPYFIKSIEHLEYFYEEWDYSTQYNLIDGKIVEINDKFIKYNDYDNYF